MAFERIEKPTWKTFFDRLSKTLSGRSASLEVAGLDVGDQVEASALTLLALTYDVRDDAVYVSFESHGRSYERAVRSPREVHVEVGDAGLSMLVVIDAEGRKQFLRLLEPLKLPENAQPTL